MEATIFVIEINSDTKMTRLQKLALVGFGILTGLVYGICFKYLDPHYADPDKPVYWSLCIIYTLMVIWVIFKKDKP